jgi:hypothetical protein
VHTVADKLAVDHVARPPLPWRDSHLTECGRPLGDLPIISRDELESRLTNWGKRRTAMATCITCCDNVRRYTTWQVDPVAAIAREVDAFRYHLRGQQGPMFAQLRLELRAVEALIEAHRDEFDGFIAAAGQATDLDAARRSRRDRRYTMGVVKP